MYFFPISQLSNDPVASTSQAAAALNENQAQRIVSETGEEFLGCEGVPNKQRRLGAENKETDPEKADGDSFSVCDFEDLQNSVGSPLFDLDEDAKKELDEMLQSTAPPYHHPHPHHGHPHAHPIATTMRRCTTPMPTMLLLQLPPTSGRCSRPTMVVESAWASASEWAWAAARAAPSRGSQLPADSIMAITRYVCIDRNPPHRQKRYIYL